MVLLIVMRSSKRGDHHSQVCLTIVGRIDIVLLGKGSVLSLTIRCVKGLALLSFFTVFALSGCAEEQPQHLSDLEAAGAADEEHLTSLESWIFPPADAEAARRGFVERCVAAADGIYKEPERTYSLDTTVYTGRTTQELKDSGYGALPASQGQAIADFGPKGLDLYLGTSAETFTVNFMGFNTGKIAVDGCMAQSYEYIYGTAEDGLKVALLAPQFATSIATEVRADERYTALQEKWNQCMTDAGYPGVGSTDQAVYRSTLIAQDRVEGMLTADISCRESNDFDATVSEIKGSYYETVYKRVKQFSEDIEAIHATAAERVEADKADPQATSTVTVPEPTPTATDGQSGEASASPSNS